jgi:hypothetical protein
MLRKYVGSFIGCALVALTLSAEVSAQGRGNQAPPPPVTAPDAEGFVIVTPEALADARSSGTGRTHYLYGHPSQPGL